MDFVYRAHLTDEEQKLTLLEEEATELRWFTTAEIATLDERTEIFANVKHYILQILGERPRQ
jgi:hypothetical protein